MTQAGARERPGRDGRLRPPEPRELAELALGEVPAPDREDVGGDPGEELAAPEQAGLDPVLEAGTSLSGFCTLS